MKSTCEMVVNWKVNDLGEPGDEIECGKPAIWSNGRLAFCDECARERLADGDWERSEVTLLPTPCPECEWETTRILLANGRTECTKCGDER